jgi:hypothetical protein
MNIYNKKLPRSRLSMNIYNKKLLAQGCSRHLDQSGAATARRDLA